MEIDDAAILIKKAALEFDKISNQILEKYELTSAQYKVLKYLYEEAVNGVRITDLERYYSMAHPTTIGIVRNLEKKGLTGYQDNPNDQRSRYIVPTKKALAIKDELVSAGEILEMELTKNLNDKEHEELVNLLKKMIDVPNK